MKKLITFAVLVVALTGCNAMTTAADNAMKKQSSFSQDPTTHYPTVDGSKEGEPAEFGKDPMSK